MTVSPQTILLLDDHPACLEAWDVLLQDLWPDVVCVMATTLERGLQILTEGPPVDLVCADLALPGSPPKHTLQALIQILPPSIPLILISGSVDALQGYDMLRVGADSFCPKGMEPTQMQHRLYMTWASACGRRARVQAWNTRHPEG